MPFLNIMMEPMAGGYGARPELDGMDTGGLFCIPMGRIPDVEMTEFLYPLLTLWRREEADSGGPGRQRGGVSASLAVALHGSQVPAGVVFASAGKAVAQNNGLAGGYPGNTGLEVLVRGADVHRALAEGRIPQSVEDFGGEAEIAPCYAQSYLAPGEVLYMNWQGGGGYGDPLRRDPEAVAADVREFKVTPGAAADVYGVVLAADGSADVEATAERRRELAEARGSRSGAAPAPDPAATSAPDPASDQASDPAGTVDLATARRIDDNLVMSGSLVGCAHCGQKLADTTTDTQLALLRYDGPVTEAGPQIVSDPRDYIDDEVVFRQLSCPGCYTAVYSGVVPKVHVDHSTDIARFAGV